jgi:hypothetical protein
MTQITTTTTTVKQRKRMKMMILMLMLMLNAPNNGTQSTTAIMTLKYEYPKKKNKTHTPSPLLSDTPTTTSTTMEHEHEHVTTRALSSFSLSNSNRTSSNTAEQQQNNHHPNSAIRRSGISLLLGALLQSQALHHIQMESVELILHKEEGDDNMTTPDDGRVPHDKSNKHEDKHKNNSRLLLVHASLLITVSVPYLEQGGPFFSSSKAGTQGHNQRVTTTTTTAAVPSVTKMLHTLIQSNWHKLETCALPKLLTLTLTSPKFANANTTHNPPLSNARK